MQAELLIDAMAALGEGSIWDPRARRLWWVDIVGKTLNCFNPATAKSETHPMPSMIGTVVPRREGGLVVALEDGFHYYDPKTQTLAHIINPEPDRADNRMNDGKCDPAGRLWAGTMHKNGKPEAGALYRLEPDGRCEKVLEPVSISNGIVWDSVRETLYYIDTPTRRVDAFDYELTDGSIRNRRPVLRIPESRGFPDGMAIDAEGKLWIAEWGGGCVSCWDPLEGTFIRDVQVPARRVTSCAFGGDALDTLFITTAREGGDPADLERHPASGGVFACQPGATGVPAVPFAG